MKIGFIGVGVMGNGMVKNLLQQGYEVNAYTRTRAKALEALDAGAVWRENVADCVRDADAVISLSLIHIWSFSHMPKVCGDSAAMPLASMPASRASHRARCKW